ncbi:MAG: winged helix-turn-helix transcriptional regulator [Hyphomicrobiales bacterium]|nr:winged helix-turn-helix transcriptional regulator [Hyphomicrobiales bacterium]
MQNSKIKHVTAADRTDGPEATYVLDVQVGFLLRRAAQRHLAIFFEHLPDMTSTQFAALAKLCEVGRISQNELGRRIAMDAATVKGVVDRLRARGFAETKKDPEDQRRLLVSPTGDGQMAFENYRGAAVKITRETLAPLNEDESEALLKLLSKLG